MPRLRPPKLAAKPVRSLEPAIFLAVFLGIFCLIGSRMGAVNMLSTMMNTAYQLLLDTVFYIMAVAVLAGALLGLFQNSASSRWSTGCCHR